MEPMVAFATSDELLDGDRGEFYLSILSAEEKTRLVRLRSESQRNVFLLAHGLLRTALSKCAPVDPAVWEFKTDKYGRPEIAAPQSSLRFNLSHTEGLAACVVTDGRDVGIDVEDRTRRGRPDRLRQGYGGPPKLYAKAEGRHCQEHYQQHYSRLAERFFSPREQIELRTLPVHEQPVRFFELWTLKEAYLKARGVGLTLSLKAFSFYQDEEGEWRIAFTPIVDDDPRRWTFRSSRVGDRHQAALAVSVD